MRLRNVLIAVDDMDKAIRFYREIFGLQVILDQDTLALIKYIADGDKMENPSVIKTPVVRNGKQSTLGYQPEVWKGWN